MSAPQLPKAWRLGCLNDVAAKVPNAIVDGPFGSNLKLSDYVNSGVPVLQGKNITNDRFRWFDVRFISEGKAEELKRSSVRVGDLLMVKIGSIGYSAIVDSLAGYDFAVIPANLAKITPDLNLVDREYLHHWLTSPEAKRYLLASASKTAQPALSLGKIKALPIPIPPLEEQRRIAAILDQAETLRTQRRQALAHLDTLTQSLFLDMFGDPVENEKGVPVCQLQALCNRITDGTHQSPGWVEEGIPFLFISNIVDGAITFDTHKFIAEDTYFELTRRCPIEIGDVLYTTVGSYGNAAVVTDDKRFAFQRHIAHIKPDISKANSLFLAAMIQSIGVRRQVDKVAKGVAQKTVNLADLKGLTVFAPPLPLQQTFATRIQAIEALKATHRTALAQLDALFASLQQRAFAGEL